VGLKGLGFFFYVHPDQLFAAQIDGTGS